MTERANTIADRLAVVRDRVAAAADRSGRDASDVVIVAVAKKFTPDDVAEAADAGVDVIGENRVQEAAQKIPLCPSHLRWHMVGHLQTNKVRPAVALFEMIHGVDSLRLLEAVDRACAERGGSMPVCLQVNVSGEGSKFGMAPGEVPTALEASGSLLNVDVTGVMAIPPFSSDPEDARPYFRQLRELRDKCCESLGVGLPELSMGMTSDFEVAIEEGATMIRLGSALFGPRGAKM